jgi:hypothetical protein
MRYNIVSIRIWEIPRVTAEWYFHYSIYTILGYNCQIPGSSYYLTCYYFFTGYNCMPGCSGYIFGIGTKTNKLGISAYIRPVGMYKTYIGNSGGYKCAWTICVRINCFYNIFIVFGYRFIRSNKRIYEVVCNFN